MTKTDSRDKLSVMNQSQIQRQIEQVKKELAELGPVHPGSLSEQYNICGTPGCHCKDTKNPQKHGPYYQLSYVHKGKSTTQFIRPTFVEEIQKQLENYKLFKALTEEWVHLSIELSRLKLDLARRNKPKEPSLF